MSVAVHAGSGSFGRDESAPVINSGRSAAKDKDTPGSAPDPGPPSSGADNDDTPLRRWWSATAPPSPGRPKGMPHRRRACKAEQHALHARRRRGLASHARPTAEPTRRSYRKTSDLPYREPLPRLRSAPHRLLGLVTCGVTVERLAAQP